MVRHVSLAGAELSTPPVGACNQTPRDMQEEVASAGPTIDAWTPTRTAEQGSAALPAATFIGIDDNFGRAFARARSAALAPKPSADEARAAIVARIRARSAGT